MRMAVSRRHDNLINGTDSAIVAQALSQQHEDINWDIYQIIDDIKMLLSSHQDWQIEKLEIHSLEFFHEMVVGDLEENVGIFP
ncbi:hypothetical protein NC653_034201 [Populus alba x Populus x berolinensis]|uniref:Uncharacterized protein n=1 Tax=Populus alba x Populus x berolinensis TaxID=444605 RepID=A0AAD6PVS3_9ROSI|nr:hypothetical protein NC653_034201 [Populus alba x Populus x berolinensis]